MKKGMEKQRKEAKHRACLAGGHQSPLLGSCLDAGPENRDNTSRGVSLLVWGRLQAPFARAVVLGWQSPTSRGWPPCVPLLCFGFRAWQALSCTSPPPAHSRQITALTPRGWPRRRDGSH